MGTARQATSATTARDSILIWYDGSREAGRAIEAAAALLGRRRAVVVDVVPRMTSAESLAATASGVPGNAFEAVNEAEARRVAGRGAELARAAGLEAEPRGELASITWLGIVDIADELDVAAVVVGSKGPSGAKKLLDTGLPQQLVEHAGRPVLIVPPPR
jgi:nucleotide-binding universal stress UspA family protein